MHYSAVDSNTLTVESGIIAIIMHEVAESGPITRSGEDA
jgi:hypothetical protein